MSDPEGFEDLIRLARAGDETAVARLTRAYEPFLRRFVRARMRLNIDW